MSRHRDIRNMDYSEDYDGYDDVYGHSVDDDYYISPSNKQFIYNRDISQRSSEGDIKEEDESEAELSDIDRTKLASCIIEINNTLQSINISRNDLVNIIIKEKFDVEKSINTILKDSRFKSEATEKDYNQQTKISVTMQPIVGLAFSPQASDSKKQFTIPNIFNKIPNTDKSSVSQGLNNTKSKFIIPNLSTNATKPKFTIPNLSTSGKPNFTKPNFTIPNLPTNSNVTIPNLIMDANKQLGHENTESVINNEKSFHNLSDLVSSHLKNSSVPVPMVDIKKQMKNLSLNSADVSTVAPQLAKMSVSEPHLSNLVPNNSQNKFQIDLSLALKTTISTPLVSTKLPINNIEESFDIPFVNCDEDVLVKRNEPLICSFDISRIKDNHFKLEKNKSLFGKIVCRRYKQCVKSILRKNYIDSVERFNFSTLSPDSRISAFLKR